MVRIHFSQIKPPLVWWSKWGESVSGKKEDLLKSCLAVNGIYVNMIFFCFYALKNLICAVKRNLQLDTGADPGLF